jgi:hypothetical protein
VISQPGLCVQAGLNIAQALAKSHLRKTQRQKMVPQRKSITARSRHVARGICTLKLPVWNTRHDLAEDSLTGVHPASDLEKRPPCSNREQALSSPTPCKNVAYITISSAKWDTIGTNLAPIPKSRRASFGIGASPITESELNPPSFRAMPDCFHLRAKAETI